MDAERQRTLTCILDLGEMLLEAGAEVSRVEDTITRLGHAYAFARVDTFTTISSIVVTMRDADGCVYTETRRIQSIGTDMERVSRLNELSRELCRACVPSRHFSERLAQAARTLHYSPLQITVFWGFTSAAFTVFFGGNAADMALSFVSAMLLRLMVACGIRAGMQNFVLYFVNSFAAGLMISLVTTQSAVFSYDKIAMGNIMLLIPGIALTTAIRDMIKGDLLSGSLEICSALIQAGAIAIGFAAASLLF